MPKYPAIIRIYGQADFIGATKKAGPYNGKPFIHDFKKGAEIQGIDQGATLILKDGRAFKINKRAVLVVSKSHLWGMFAA